MHVDAATKDAFGTRRASSPRGELIFWVYADAAKSSFTLYEEYGRTLPYDADGHLLYNHLTTEITQQEAPSVATVTVGATTEVNG